MTDKSGYGLGFCAQFRPEVTCINAARGGRSSKSYRVEGLWDKVMSQVTDRQGFQATYVLIQFGHNDGSSKPERHTNIETEFPVNMRNYARDVVKAGGVPVLVTPLTQRHFRNGRVNPDLLPWATATRLVARSEGVALMDLNAESYAAVQAMGLPESNSLAGQPIPQNILDTQDTGTSVPAIFTDASQADSSVKQAFDYTHVGPKGSAFFGRMAADLLVKAQPALRVYFQGS
ncbi:SGNH/GDSL hydrolase family protein [Asticcacaulis sp. AC466]|uniref:SGNH/GDSL hydrolase family protein n=1 Tax=Asticcacaulis sp. AC466 TaxID=1282362 RepID=UPI001F2BE003|nr:SGNH/GDSL hydrolase family protein [Asticcacaulis sp. AC466]